MGHKEGSVDRPLEDKRVVRIVVGPVVVDMGSISRAVVLDDGTFNTQSYIRKKGWRFGVVGHSSIMTAPGGVYEHNLREEGYSEEQIAEILEVPEAEFGKD